MDEQFRNRWRTLLSVDELVDGVLSFMSDHSLLEKSYVIFTSDHGYHLGNYGLPYGKRMPYDTGTLQPRLAAAAVLKFIANLLTDDDKLNLHIFF